ncbi:F-box domain protein [Aspergillus clavatus NRRL 1]|uniref:F-box domain protein n=1 Tax=Aspergillus clavatus (strain ATCC 1007 / CBS 513.65 / DSM 816 / NCTC 3887 / NRRL 1 / QM 1276 / 107) TaxID=344612 RepID=A1C8Z5_ASPCL|nr:F-box domain protein [Aspergillus clavatus NRRL 1]EAW13319.1 F-box domain protein [Aspergillus clavatus NRRL 1]
MCHWQYLSLGIATHREENWTVACLLKSEALCRTQSCGHTLNLDRGRRFTDWTVVARLWGFQDSSNSLGCKVAASDRGTRLAVANWNVIYVWALEPGALIEENSSGFYPVCFRSKGSGLIELRPIVLPLDGVCFKLGFTQREDELLAITDRGVMYWDLGPLGRGSRDIQQLVL